MNSKNGILASNFNGIESPCIYLRVAIRDRVVDGLFDTGSPITAISADLCRDYKLSPYEGSFRSCTGHSLNIVGCTIVDMVYKDKPCPIPCVVVKNPVCPLILGMNWITRYCPVNLDNDGSGQVGNTDHQVAENKNQADVIDLDGSEFSEGVNVENVDSRVADIQESVSDTDNEMPDLEGDESGEVVAMIQGDDLRDAQGRDIYCQSMKVSKDFVLRDGVLYKVYAIGTGPIYRAVIPVSMREAMVSQAHDSATAGHVGVDKTLARLKQSYFWPGMKSYVEKYVGSCGKCQTRNIAKMQLKAPIQLLPVVGVFQRVYMDFVICPKSSRGHSSILTVIDSTSKFLIAIPMRTQDAIATATALIMHVFLIFGFPHELFSDRGTNFTSDIVKTITHVLGIHSVFSSAYSPHSSGQVERVNQTIIDIVAKVVKDEPKRWSDLLPYAVWAYNSAVHSSTSFAPYHVVFGIPPKDPNIHPMEPGDMTQLTSVLDHVKFGFTTVRDRVRENITHAASLYKRYADKSVRRDPEFTVGEQVLVRAHTSPKFGERFGGPFTILRIINPASLWIRDEVTTRQFSVNVDKCKRYVSRGVQPKDFDIVVVEQQEEPSSPPPNMSGVPNCPPAPSSIRVRGVDTNPSRCPIQRDPYELRVRK